MKSACCQRRTRVGSARKQGLLMSLACQARTRLAFTERASSKVRVNQHAEHKCAVSMAVRILLAEQRRRLGVCALWREGMRLPVGCYNEPAPTQRHSNCGTAYCCSTPRYNPMCPSG